MYQAFDPSPSFVDQLLAIAQQAATITLRYHRKNISIEYKEDESPVTIADQESNQCIVEQLTQLTPHIPVIAEEDDRHTDLCQQTQRFWLVDPLDGTKEFIQGRDDFTINIALIEQGRPTVAVQCIPAQSLIYLALGDQGAYRITADGTRQRIYAKTMNETHPIMVVSRSHLSSATQSFIERYPHAEVQARGSSLKLCLLAEGVADMYPRFSTTMEWDTAAGHAILLAAGGNVMTLDNKELTYGKEGFVNPHFIAYARKST